MLQNLSRIVKRGSLAPCLSGLLLAGAAPALAQDSVLVGDYAGSQVVKFAFPSGYAETHFVGNGMTDLYQTRGMTFGPDGNLYISSGGVDKITRVDGVTGVPIPLGTDGTFVAAAAGGLNQPMGLTFGPDGRLYVSSYLTNAINVYNGTTGAPLGLFVPAASGGLSGPFGLAFNGGFLYVCSYLNNQVLRYNGTTGAFVDVVVAAGQSGLASPRGVVFDGSGRMYITSGSNAVIVKDPSAGFSVLASNSTIPLLTNPQLLSLTPTNQLMVPCYGSGTVQMVDHLSGLSLGTLTLNGAGGLANVMSVLYMPSTVACYANCDNSVTPPVLNVNDFICFLNKFAAGCP